jgi:hypothetical protein
MNLNAAALKLLAAKGLTLEDVAEIVAATEVTRDPTAAERQARCRARKRTSRRDVTRDPLNEELLNPSDTPTPSGVGPKAVTDKSRGTRLPNDWMLPPEWAAWARDRRNWSDKDVAEEALLFANYWHSRTGAGAVHRDWFKTWQNWTVRSHRKDGEEPKRAATIPEQIANLKKSIEFYSRQNKPDLVRECRDRIAKLEGGSGLRLVDQARSAA